MLRFTEFMPGGNVPSSEALFLAAGDVASAQAVDGLFGQTRLFEHQLYVDEAVCAGLAEHGVECAGDAAVRLTAVFEGTNTAGLQPSDAGFMPELLPDATLAWEPGPETF